MVGVLVVDTASGSLLRPYKASLLCTHVLLGSDG